MSQFQIDLPDEIRVKMRESQGTLKLIKVLTKQEYAEVLLREGKISYKPKNKPAEAHKQSNYPKMTREQRWARAGCAYSLFNRNWKKFAGIEPYMCLKFMIEGVSRRFCAWCECHEKKSRWQIHFHISPVDTGNIEILLWHNDYKSGAR